MNKHTPGPWRVVDSWNDHMVEGQNGEEIIWQDGPHGTPTINEANARLIAAAPDLLAVLEELQESAAYWSEYDVPIGIVDRINAAIAKAKGEV
jgi:hypothetical protein